MARRKKKGRRKTSSLKERKDIITSVKKPEDFLLVDLSVWWEANPDKSKKYGNKEFKGKKELTPKEAMIFLGVTENWLGYFVHGEKGFPKLPYTWDNKNKATVKFARKDLVEYRAMLRSRMLSVKAKQISKCHEHERDQ
jgi:hypothetical protein